MNAREILARAMYEASRTPGDSPAWEGRLYRKEAIDWWLSLADAAIAVSGPFNAAVWREGFEAGQKEYIEGEIVENPYEEHVDV